MDTIEPSVETHTGRGSSNPGIGDKGASDRRTRTADGAPTAGRKTRTTRKKTARKKATTRRAGSRPTDRLDPVDRSVSMPPEIAEEFRAAESLERRAERLPGEPVPHVASPDDWMMEVKILVGIIRGQTLGWNWPPEQVKILEDGLCGVLHKMVPGGAGAFERWGPGVKVVLGASLIALTNYDWNARAFRSVRKVIDDGRRTDSGGGREPSRQDRVDDAADASGSKAPGVGPQRDVGTGPVPAGAGAGSVA